MSSTKRAALYVRVSTDAQTVENQIRELRQVARRRGSMPVQCACVNLTIARVRMILKREFGWTTQGSRILLLPDDLNTGPGTGHVVTISAAGSHRYSHRRLNSLPAQPV